MVTAVTPTKATPKATTRTRTWTSREQRALRALRTRYQSHGDLFTNDELARLQFVRWLVHTGRLAP